MADGAAEAPIDYSSAELPTTIFRIKDELALRARKRMYSVFSSLMTTTSQSRILDVGVTPEQNLKSANFFETFHPWKSQITATSIEDASYLEQRYPGLRFVRTSGGTLPFDDGQFDVVFSSAVIEHVGDAAHQQAFVDEVLRVGRSFFMTTPNRWFPIDLHTALPVIHWMPQDCHHWALRLLGKDAWATVEKLNLLSASRLINMFPAGAHARLVRFRTGGMTSNLIVYGGM